MNFGKWHIHYSAAVVVSIIAAALAVLVSFGAHLTQENIHSILILVGLIAGGITVGGGIVTGLSIHARSLERAHGLHPTDRSEP